MWARWWDEAVAPRLSIARHVPVAGLRLATTLLAVNVLLGLLPVAFVVATSVLIGLVPAAVAGGAGSPAWDALVRAFLVAAGAFVAQQALAPVQLGLGELVKRRVDGHLHDRIIEAALRSTGIGLMEDRTALDYLKEASRRLEGSWQTPGMAVGGQLALVARYTRLAGFAALVGVAASWPAAVALVVAVLVFRYGNRGGLRRYSQVFQRTVALIRRATYLRDLGLRDRAAKELRVFGLTGWVSERYASMYRDWLAPMWRERRRIYLFPYLGYAAVGLLVALGVFLPLARGAATGALTLTELALGLQAALAALLLGQYFPECDDATQAGMLAAGGLARFEAYAGRDRAAAGAAAVEKADLRFEGISFSYPGAARRVFDGLDLELAAGRCTAVVGVNGAGKTTLVKLLTRLHEPAAGAIRFGGTDLRELPVAYWRRQVSVIFQDFIRYELSILDNVAFGAPHVPADPARVRRALSLAGMLDDLPEDLETPLSRGYPGGIELSGGQWQRIAIARSLYALDAGARVLVLDEPTAALDVRAEARFFERFVSLTRGVTSLLISHRFSSVRHADHIVVIEDGRVVEQGTHESLALAGGRYAELFHLQAERFAAGLDADGQVVLP